MTRRRKAEARQARWRMKQRLAGRCEHCGREKADKDAAFAWCFLCRLKNAARMARAYAKRGGWGGRRSRRAA